MFFLLPAFRRLYNVSPDIPLVASMFLGSVVLALNRGSVGLVSRESMGARGPKVYPLAMFGSEQGLSSWLLLAFDDIVEVAGELSGLAGG